MHPLDPPVWVRPLVERARDAGEDVRCALEIAVDVGRQLPDPGAGRTRERWAVLAELGRVNLTVARVVEAHADALAILHESGSVSPDGTWGVFAAESPDGAGLAVTDDAGGPILDGTKPWCSLGGVLDHALVTAHGAGGRRGLFAVDLRHDGVRADPARGWVARGLRTVTSVPVTFSRVPARPVGGVDWYLERPGFAWGGIGVAACWFGGATGLVDTLRSTAGRRTGELNALHVGIVDAALFAAATTLEHAADAVDTRTGDGALLASRVRAVIADAVETVLRQVGHALGPAPLAFDQAHAARVADLELYVRQHHGERDLAALGERILKDAAQA